MAIALDDVGAMPAALLESLTLFDARLKVEPFLDTLLEDSSLKALADGLERWVLAQKVRVYHCSKAPSLEYYLSSGLRILDLESHQREFLELYGQNFTESEINFIREAWSKYYRGQQVGGRNGRLWFCASRSLVTSRGAEGFFKYPGGEAIYKPLDPTSGICSRLETLGIPVVVELILPANEIQVNGTFSKPLLSQYHRLVNPKAHVLTCQGHILRNVLQPEIKSIIPLSKFIP